MRPAFFAAAPRLEDNPYTAYRFRALMTWVIVSLTIIFLTADTIGFRYRYDPQTGQYAHASGCVILTPDGRVSRYFFGVNFNPQELRLSNVVTGRLSALIT